MRTVIIFLFWALLAFRPGLAQPVPTLEVATNREFYHADANNKVYVKTRIDTTAAASAPGSSTIRNIAFVLDHSRAAKIPHYSTTIEMMALLGGSITVS
jgi:hypothetical protein